MAPVNLLCKGFLKSLVTGDTEQKEQRKVRTDDIDIDEKHRFLFDESDSGDKSEEDDPEFIEMVESKRVWLNKSENPVAKKDSSVMEKLAVEKRLARIMKQSISIDL